MESNGTPSRAAEPSSLRVLFIHGLESGPHGTKVQYLRRHFKHVLAPDQEVSLHRLNRRRSVPRSILRQPRVWVILSMVATGLVLLARWRSWRWPLPSAACLLCGLSCAYVYRRPIIRQGFRSSLRGCVSVACSAIKQFEPDVVVGSSWGGAVLASCMELGHWRGPAVLLAPAYHRVVEMMGGPLGDGLPDDNHKAKPSGAGVVMVQSRDDETVDYRDTRKLAQAMGARLIELQDAGHRLDPLVAEPGGRLAALVVEAYELHAKAGENGDKR